MPESGNLPHRLRSHKSSAPTRTTGAGRLARDDTRAHRQPSTDQARSGQAQSSKTPLPKTAVSKTTDSKTTDLPLHPLSSDARDVTRRHRLTLWQVLFGRGKKRTARRSTLQQAKRKDVKAVNDELPLNFFQRLNRNERSTISDQTASRMAEAQVRQAVLGRSRQLNGAPATANVQAPGQRGKRSNTRQATTQRSSHAIPAFQSLPKAGGREQANPPDLRRNTRERVRRDASAHRTRGFLQDTRTTDLKTRSSAPAHQRETSPRSRSLSAGIYAARMLILSVGIGVLVGTMLSMLDPASRLVAGASQQTTNKTAATESTKATQATALAQGGSPTENASAVQLPQMGQELTTLKAALQNLALQTPQLTPGIFLFDLDTTAYLDLNGGASFAAASTIKVPILVAFFQDVDAGKIRLDELLTMQKDLVAGGSGEMQGFPVGTQFTALETVTKMITISDNTATNMVIARLGGMTALDQRFRSWGLVSTALNSMLPDLSGTNTTSPKDMSLLMTRISQGELVSMRSRDRVLDIMQRTVNRSQLPQGLGKGATIAHKTGDIGGLIGDVGLIDMPNGKRYALTVLVKRSFNDDEAYDLVQKASRTVYQYLNRATASQNDPSAKPSAPGSAATPQADGDAPANSSSPSIPTDATITQSPSFGTATQ